MAVDLPDQVEPEVQTTCSLACLLMRSVCVHLNFDHGDREVAT